MTLLEVLDGITLEVRSRIGADWDLGSPAYLKFLVNEGAGEFARDTRIVKGYIKLDVEAEQPLYDVYQENQANDALSRRGLEVLDVWYQGRRVPYANRGALPDNYKTELGEPRGWWMAEADIIEFYPTPPDEITEGVELYCVLAANKVTSDVDEPNTPPEWHQTLIWYVVWRLIDGLHPRAQWYLDRYLLNVEKAKAHAARNMTQTVRHTKPRW